MTDAPDGDDGTTPDTDGDGMALNRAHWEDLAELHPTTEFYDVHEGAALVSQPERGAFW